MLKKDIYKFKFLRFIIIIALFGIVSLNYGCGKRSDPVVGNNKTKDTLLYNYYG